MRDAASVHSDHALPHPSDSRSSRSFVVVVGIKPEESNARFTCCNARCSQLRELSPQSVHGTGAKIWLASGTKVSLATFAPPVSLACLNRQSLNS